ncbi:hypothetical protein RF11_05412 [Thelohanellus kitauei]|uniref:Uncharacterized protein n=1 Tax=Thelohanellus kitauei TaxID=669202 RepID=A0A0C2MDC9_THEKT|nr:hypothetical protein RF11_05412 [Thelohanellus kitauei]
MVPGVVDLKPENIENFSEVDYGILNQQLGRDTAVFVAAIVFQGSCVGVMSQVWNTSSSAVIEKIQEDHFLLEERGVQPRPDLMSSSYRLFEQARLNPGDDPTDFTNALLNLIKKARPSITESDQEFLVLQKLFNCIPDPCRLL